MFTIITENDESAWEDETGFLYHFPKRYLKYLTPGTNVIYYKGTLKKRAFAERRLSDAPHYFAAAKIGKVYPDTKSSKGDFFATIADFVPFNKAVLAKNHSGYLETFPEQQKNYWRNGVRIIDQTTYNLILSHANQNEVSEKKSTYMLDNNLNDISNTLESSTEGRTTKRYITTYERNPKYRKQAIAIHGDSCFACGFNFGKFYGEYAEGYIHVHHIIPVSALEGPKSIDPETDLVPLCANCHSVVHRKKDETLSIDKLKVLIEGNSK